jgi:hypothetical protein
MASIPQTSAHFTTSLASKITSSASSMTLVSATDKAGNALSGLYGFVVDKGSASEEFMLGTVSGTTVTIVTRGLSPADGKTNVAALQLAHRRGATVDITDYPLLAILLRIANGDESFPNPINLGSQKITNLATPTASTDAANKSYVDGVAIAGAPDSSTSVKGIVKMSTAPVSPTSPIAVGDNDSRVPTAGQAAALPGDNSDIAVGAGNKFMTQTGAQKAAENYVASTGSANAYVVTLSPVPTSYAAGMVVRFKANFANTGAATVNVNGLGAISIKKLDGATALVSGDIASGQLVVLVHDGTNFQMASPSGIAPVSLVPAWVDEGTKSWAASSTDQTLTLVNSGKDVYMVVFELDGATSGFNVQINSETGTNYSFIQLGNAGSILTQNTTSWQVFDANAGTLHRVIGVLYISGVAGNGGSANSYTISGNVAASQRATAGHGLVSGEVIHTGIAATLSTITFLVNSVAVTGKIHVYSLNI